MALRIDRNTQRPENRLFFPFEAVSDLACLESEATRRRREYLPEPAARVCVQCVVGRGLLRSSRSFRQCRQPRIKTATPAPAQFGNAFLQAYHGRKSLVVFSSGSAERNLGTRSLASASRHGRSTMVVSSLVDRDFSGRTQQCPS